MGRKAIVKLEQILDQFLMRGEDIDAECGREGTVLHCLLLRSSGIAAPTKLTLDRGANANAEGPQGKFLKVAWDKTQTDRLASSEAEDLAIVMELLLDHGADVVDCEDKDGSRLTREGVIDWCSRAHRKYQETPQNSNQLTALVEEKYLQCQVARGICKYQDRCEFVTMLLLARKYLTPAEFLELLASVKDSRSNLLAT